MRATVMISLGAASPLKQMLGDRYDVLEPLDQNPADTYTADQLAAVRAIVVNGGGKEANRLMDCLPELKLIACRGSGFDAVDVARAKQRGIVVAHSPGANAYSVAEQAMALMLAALRSTARGDTAVRAGQWAAVMFNTPLGYCVHERRIGIYGMGEIGQKIAARCAGFEADVQYYSRRRIDGLPYAYHDSLESLAEWCDVLHVAVRAGPETKDVINRDILKRLGPNGFVVNITRGSVVDEDALIEALKTRVIAGAALDVLKNEPNVRSDFFDLPNVVLAPHQGGNTIEAYERMQARVVENVDAFFSGRPVPYPVPQ